MNRIDTMVVSKRSVIRLSAPVVGISVFDQSLGGSNNLGVKLIWCSMDLQNRFPIFRALIEKPKYPTPARKERACEESPHSTAMSQGRVRPKTFPRGPWLL